MSLKAKIEAVIYASEEPVTLAQLTGLLGQEGQIELDRLDATQQSLPLDAEQPRHSQSEPQPSLREPEATASAPAHEPDPMTSSPIPEHPEAHPEAQPDTKAAAARPARDPKHDERVRERRLREYFRSILDELIADYATSARGLEIREVASGYRLATKPEYHDAVRGFVKSLKPPLKLSLQALETLAVVAYKQPITAPEISEIRGVDSGGVLGSLMARKLITTAGRKQVIGRPILYKTTRDFLLRFGLKDVSELPSIEEFEKMAGELADTFAEPVQEEIPMQTESPTDLEEEKNEVEPQADGDSIPLEGSDESSAGVPGTTVATPEGDNEFAPDQPLEPIDEGRQKPPAIDTNAL